MGEQNLKGFLLEVAEAPDVTSINIAAGVAASRLTSRRRLVVRLAGYAAAAVLALDLFAASPIHVGVFAVHAHVFTHLGLPDQTK